MTKQTEVQPSIGYIQNHLVQTVTEARNAYGDKAQVVIAMEELCELSCAIAKFVRYPTTEEAVLSTKEKVISEMADVLVMLETLTQIYEVDSNALYATVESKLIRLDGWLSKGPELTITTIDRLLQ